MNAALLETLQLNLNQAPLGLTLLDDLELLTDAEIKIILEATPIRFHSLAFAKLEKHNRVTDEIVELLLPLTESVVLH